MATIGPHFVPSPIPKTRRGQAEIDLNTKVWRGGWAAGMAPWFEEVLAFSCQSVMQAEGTLKDWSLPSLASLRKDPLGIALISQDSHASPPLRTHTHIYTHPRHTPHLQLPFPPPGSRRSCTVTFMIADNSHSHKL